MKKNYVVVTVFSILLICISGNVFAEKGKGCDLKPCCFDELLKSTDEHIAESYVNAVSKLEKDIPFVLCNKFTENDVMKNITNRLNDYGYDNSKDESHVINIKKYKMKEDPYYLISIEMLPRTPGGILLMSVDKSCRLVSITRGV